VNQEVVESQLSAMFDGELPAAECELLSRRIDRDERLRARWSRYALIGAAMRSEPVATAPSGFAARVSAALDAAEPGAQGLGVGERPAAAVAARWPAAKRQRRWASNALLAASVTALVAGSSLALLRHSTMDLEAPAGAALAVTAANSALPASAPSAVAAAAAGAVANPSLTDVADRSRGGREPWSYVTPADHGADPTALRTQLADYIVAHSEYSTPLMRRNLLSALVSSGDEEDAPDSIGAAGAPRTQAGGADATTQLSSAAH